MCGRTSPNPQKRHPFDVYICGSVSYKFGLVGMAAGALGVPAGSWLAQRLRPRYPDCDPTICGLALLASTPLVYLALVAVDVHVALTYLLIFLGMLTLNLTWSIVADMVLVSTRSLWCRFRCALYSCFGWTLGRKV